MKRTKKFDFTNKPKKATVIDCLECENYYTGACDARAGGCGDYTPTRKITMTEDIKRIERRQRAMFVFLACMYVAILCTYIAVRTM